MTVVWTQLRMKKTPKWSSNWTAVSCWRKKVSVLNLTKICISDFKIGKNYLSSKQKRVWYYIWSIMAKRIKYTERKNKRIRAKNQFIWFVVQRQEMSEKQMFSIEIYYWTASILFQNAFQMWRWVSLLINS